MHYHLDMLAAKLMVQGSSSESWKGSQLCSLTVHKKGQVASMNGMLGAEEVQKMPQTKVWSLVSEPV